MSENENAARQMVNCYSEMDADRLRQILHEDARHTAPGSDFGTDLVGQEQIFSYFRDRVFPAFKTVRFEIIHLYEDLERSAIVVEWRSHLQPKTGKDYSNSGVFVIEFRDGKIYWVREYFDTEKAHQNV